jgi:hypothetical protein
MRPLSWLRRKEPPQESRTTALAMVLLPESAAVDGTVVLEHLRTQWSDVPRVAEISTEEGVTTARIPGGIVALGYIPAPVPAGDLEGPAAVAWHWPTAQAELARHRGHVIVHASSTSLDPLDLRLLHTKLVASVVATADAIGVYVGGAMLVRSAEDYLDDAREASREDLPLLLWIGFNLVSEDAELSVYTTGLGDFGLLELEIRRSSRPAPELFGTLADVANYQISTGRVLRDGDTFGASETDRHRVRHTESEFMSGTTVAVLEL